MFIFWCVCRFGACRFVDNCNSRGSYVNVALSLNKQRKAIDSLVHFVVFVAHRHTHRVCCCGLSTSATFILSTNTNSNARMKLIVLYKVNGTIFNFLQLGAWFARASLWWKFHSTLRCDCKIEVFFSFFSFYFLCAIFDCVRNFTTVFASVM